MSNLTKAIPCEIKSSKDYYNLLRANRAGEDQASFDYANSILACEEAIETCKDEMFKKKLHLAKSVFEDISHDERIHSLMLSFLLGDEEDGETLKIKASKEFDSIVGKTNKE